MGTLEQLVLDVLEDMMASDLEKFKFFLNVGDGKDGFSKIPKGLLENASRVDTVNMMNNYYGSEICTVTERILGVMNMNGVMLSLKEKKQILLESKMRLKDQSELKKNQSVLKKDQSELKKEVQSELKKDQSELKMDHSELKKDQSELKIDHSELKSEEKMVQELQKSAPIHERKVLTLQDQSELKKDQSVMKKDQSKLKTGPPSSQIGPSSDLKKVPSEIKKTKSDQSSPTERTLDVMNMSVVPSLKERKQKLLEATMGMKDQTELESEQKEFKVLLKSKGIYKEEVLRLKDQSEQNEVQAQLKSRPVGIKNQSEQKSEQKEVKVLQSQRIYEGEVLRRKNTSEQNEVQAQLKSERIFEPEVLSLKDPSELKKVQDLLDSGSICQEEVLSLKDPSELKMVQDLLDSGRMYQEEVLRQKDPSELKKVQNLIKSGRIHKEKLSETQCSALVHILMSGQVVNELDLKSYDTTVAGKQRLIPAVRNCRRAVFLRCSLSEPHCAVISSALSSSSLLRELNLGFNPLSASSVSVLCAGLKSPHCQLSVLNLRQCGLSEISCSSLASALKSNPSSQITKLDLSGNYLTDSGIKHLCGFLQTTDCRVEYLDLWYCGLSEISCSFLASALKSNSSKLTVLILSGNKVCDSGVKHLCSFLQSPDCRLRNVNLVNCGLSGISCSSLASALKNNRSSSLAALDLRSNTLSSSDVQELFALTCSPNPLYILSWK